MEELSNLWSQWSEGVVPPETILWGLEPYWWNRIAIALQAVALIIVFFELIGPDRRRKIVEVLDADASYAITTKIARELNKLSALIYINLVSALLSSAYLIIYIVRVILKRLLKLSPGFTRSIFIAGVRFLTAEILKLHAIDRSLGRKHKALSKFWVSYSYLYTVSTRNSILLKTYAVIYAVTLDTFGPFVSDGAYSHLITLLKTPWISFGIVSVVFLPQLLSIPLFIVSSALKIILHMLVPLFKRVFHEKYERHWIAAVLTSGIVGLHFSILIG